MMWVWGVDIYKQIRDDAYCETLAFLADALLVLNQLVDERLKQKKF